MEKTQTTAATLFEQIRQSHPISDIARLLAISPGTVDRWVRKNQVPPFYKNDLLRIVGGGDAMEESDQFYTLPVVARQCFEDAQKVLKKHKVNIADYQFVEPAAGCGHFYQLLPSARRIGVDIAPRKSPLGGGAHGDIIKADFLQWHPSAGDYIVIGNPPFGRNGKTALDFVMKSFEFADYVAFILPPIFNSTGKGSCKNRLTKMGRTLLFSRDLIQSAFVRPDGRKIGVRTCFQVWAKNKPAGFVAPSLPTCSQFVDIINIYISPKPSRPSSRAAMAGKCDIYIPRSFWGRNAARPTHDFAEIPYRDGYGLIVKRAKRNVLRFVKNFNWGEVAHVSTNGSMSLRKDIICEQLVKAGFIDNHAV